MMAITIALAAAGIMLQAAGLQTAGVACLAGTMPAMLALCCALGSANDKGQSERTPCRERQK